MPAAIQRGLSVVMDGESYPILLERIARSIATTSSARLGKDGNTAEQFSEVAWSDYLDDARHILSSMRNPSDNEIGQAIPVLSVASWEQHRLFWNALIDFALREKA